MTQNSYIILPITTCNFYALAVTFGHHRKYIQTLFYTQNIKLTMTFKLKNAHKKNTTTLHTKHYHNITDTPQLSNQLHDTWTKWETCPFVENSLSNQAYEQTRGNLLQKDSLTANLRIVTK